MDNFIAQLDSIARTWIELQLNTIWQSAILLLITLTIIRIWKRPNAATRCILYSLTFFIIVLLPALNLVPFKNITFPNLLKVPKETSSTSSKLNQFQIGPIENRDDGSFFLPPIDIISPKDTKMALKDNTKSEKPTTILLTKENDGYFSLQPGIWTLYFFLIWFAVFLILLIRLIKGFWSIHKISETACDLPHESNCLLQILIKEHYRGRPVTLHLSDKLPVPFTTGFLKPKIFLPKHVFESVSMYDLNLVIMHELAHILRKDYSYNVLERIFITVFFFNPALLLLKRKLDFERECACDDFVISGNYSKEKYTQCLYNIAENSSKTKSYARFANALTGKNQLLRRVRIIVQKKNLNNANISLVSGIMGGTFLMAGLLPLLSYDGLITLKNNRVKLTKSITETQSNQGLINTTIDRAGYMISYPGISDQYEFLYTEPPYKQSADTNLSANFKKWYPKPDTWKAQFISNRPKTRLGQRGVPILNSIKLQNSFVSDFDWGIEAPSLKSLPNYFDLYPKSVSVKDKNTSGQVTKPDTTMRFVSLNSMNYQVSTILVQDTSESRLSSPYPDDEFIFIPAFKGQTKPTQDQIKKSEKQLHITSIPNYIAVSNPLKSQTSVPRFMRMSNLFVRGALIVRKEGIFTFNGEKIENEELYKDSEFTFFLSENEKAIPKIFLSAKFDNIVALYNKDAEDYQHLLDGILSGSWTSFPHFEFKIDYTFGRFAVHFELDSNPDIELEIYNSKGVLLNDFGSFYYGTGKHRLVWKAGVGDRLNYRDGILIFRIATPYNVAFIKIKTWMI